MELIKLLSESEIEQFRERTEEVLEAIGLEVQHPGLLERCRAAGAVVDEATGSVRLPRPLLRELLACVPASYTVGSADGRQWTIGGGEQYAHAIVTDPWIVDYATQTPRHPCLADLRRNTIIAQKLPIVAGISLMDYPVTDVPEPISSLRAFEEHVLHHSKHILIYATDLERYEDWLNVLRIPAATPT